MAECRYYEMCGRRSGSRNLPRVCDDRHCWMFRPMPDVDALLALADRMEKMAGKGAYLTPDGLEKVAESIREALGVES